MIRPVELTVATAGSLEVHVACDVTFCVVPSANTAVATSCVVLPAVIGPLICVANATFTASTRSFGGVVCPVSPHPAIPLSVTRSTVRKIRKFFFTGRSSCLRGVLHCIPDAVRLSNNLRRNGTLRRPRCSICVLYLRSPAQRAPLRYACASRFGLLPISARKCPCARQPHCAGTLPRAFRRSMYTQSPVERGLLGIAVRRARG